MNESARQGLVMPMDDFTCALCGGTFSKMRSDDDAEAEAQRDFDLEHAATNVGAVVVCDDCYRDMTEALPPQTWRADNAK